MYSDSGHELSSQNQESKVNAFTSTSVFTFPYSFHIDDNFIHHADLPFLLNNQTAIDSRRKRVLAQSLHSTNNPSTNPQPRFSIAGDAPSLTVLNVGIDNLQNHTYRNGDFLVISPQVSTGTINNIESTQNGVASVLTNPNVENFSHSINCQALSSPTEIESQDMHVVKTAGGSFLIPANRSHHSNGLPRYRSYDASTLSSLGSLPAKKRKLLFWNQDDNISQASTIESSAISSSGSSILKADTVISSAKILSDQSHSIPFANISPNSEEPVSSTVPSNLNKTPISPPILIPQTNDCHTVNGSQSANLIRYFSDDIPPRLNTISNPSQNNHLANNNNHNNNNNNNNSLQTNGPVQYFQPQQPRLNIATKTLASLQSPLLDDIDDPRSRWPSQTSIFGGDLNILSGGNLHHPLSHTSLTYQSQQQSSNEMSADTHRYIFSNNSINYPLQHNFRSSILPLQNVQMPPTTIQYAAHFNIPTNLIQKQSNENNQIDQTHILSSTERISPSEAGNLGSIESMLRLLNGSIDQAELKALASVLLVGQSTAQVPTSYLKAAIEAGADSVPLMIKDSNFSCPLLVVSAPSFCVAGQIAKAASRVAINEGGSPPSLNLIPVPIRFTPYQANASSTPPEQNSEHFSSTPKSGSGLNLTEEQQITLSMALLHQTHPQNNLKSSIDPSVLLKLQEQKNKGQTHHIHLVTSPLG